MSVDEEDDLGAFGFIASCDNLVIDDDVEEEEVVVSGSSIASAVVAEADRLLLLRDLEGLQKLKAEDDVESLVVAAAVKLLEGKHMELVVADVNSEPSLRQLRSTCVSEVDAVDAIRRLVLDYIEKGASAVAKECRAMQCLVSASAYLELFCQANYTGPELSSAELESLVGASYGEAAAVSLHASSIRFLECDGELAYRMCSLPHTLLIARGMLLALCDPMRASWDRGVALSESGAVLASKSKIDFAKRFPTACAAAAGLKSATWRCARAAVVHARLLPNLMWDKVPTLWKECEDWFLASLERWGCCGGGSAVVADQPNDRLLQAQLWLEWGLCHHHFSRDDKGKKEFACAQRAAGLEVYLTGAMGKRTKHQQQEHAQMLLVARSGLLGAVGWVSPAPPLPSPPSAQQKVTGKGEGEGEGEDGDSSWQHAEWEVGRRMVSDVEVAVPAAVPGSASSSAVGGKARVEEAAVREVMLDSMDGGSVQNILLEGGPQFSDSTLDFGGNLHPVDQAVILALCMDVANSNPSDGLTSEVMMPYLTRVLQAASNWMIHSTGLLERSWLEYHQQRTADRAMLQIQALLDQHTTKLTIMQSTRRSVTEESAPAQDRLSYLHCIVYPSQYELKKDLAQRYLSGSVVVSALGLFRELEMWDEVVTCYQLMEKPHRAEMVVRERLKESGETPYMLTALADLTADEELYEKAWELSRHRYGRAKRTLAKICFDRGDFHQCVRHLDAALFVHPLIATAWYLKGLASMRLESYDDALLAFGRCVQQDMEIGEAWANCGAIHMKHREHAKAYVSLTEALRHKRDSWQVMENIMICCLVLSKWHEAVMHMNRLLDMRGKSGRPIHKEELRHLALMVSSKARRAYDEVKGKLLRDDSADSDAAELEEEIKDELLPEVARTVETLLVRITNTLPSDPEVWDILANFETFLGRHRRVLDCRVRQFRTLTTEPGWEKEKESVARMLAAADKLVDAHDAPRLNRPGITDSLIVTKADMYACKSLLTAALRALENVFAGQPEATRLAQVVASFDSQYEVFVQGT